MSQHGESLWCYVKYTGCFIPTKMTQAGDGLVGSFLPSLLGCAIRTATHFSCPQPTQFCSLVPKYFDSHPVYSDFTISLEVNL